MHEVGAKSAGLCFEDALHAGVMFGLGEGAGDQIVYNPGDAGPLDSTVLGSAGGAGGGQDLNRVPAGGHAGGEGGDVLLGAGGLPGRETVDDIEQAHHFVASRSATQRLAWPRTKPSRAWRSGRRSSRR